MNVKQVEFLKILWYYTVLNGCVEIDYTPHIFLRERECQGIPREAAEAANGGFCVSWYHCEDTDRRNS